MTPEAANSGSAEDRAKTRWRMRSSNSHSEDSYCPPGRRIGVDTVSWCWHEPESVDRLLRLDGLVVNADEPPLRVVPGPGRSVRVHRRLNGLGTVGAFPAASMLFVEGRAAALQARDETNHALASPRRLASTQDQVTSDLGNLLGAAPAAIGALRRVDLAGELRFARGEDGRELLRVLDGLHSARYKTSPVRERGGPGLETAYWRTPSRSVPVLRAYDKGVESRTAAPGERIRIERQLRYAGKQRPSLEQWLTADLGSAYSGPIGHWLSGGIAIGTAGELIRVLTDAAVIWPSYWASGNSWCSSAGRLRCSLWPARKVERVLGTLAVIDAYGKSWPAWSDKQRQRRLAEVRSLGLLLLEKPVAIDVDGLVSELCDDWRRAA